MLAKHFHRVLTALALATVSATTALAQAGVITGRVIDATTKQPLADVNLIVLRQTETVARGATRQDGTYRISNVAPGEYILRARRPGYAANSSPLRVPTDRPVTLDLELTMQVTNLEQIVTTTGRGEEKEAISTPQSVSVVDAIVMLERPSVTVADHIQGLPGVDISRGGVAHCACRTIAWIPVTPPSTSTCMRSASRICSPNSFYPCVSAGPCVSRRTMPQRRRRHTCGTSTSSRISTSSFSRGSSF